MPHETRCVDDDRLEQWYTFYDYEAVTTFLAGHTSVASALLEAQQPLRHYFPDAKVTLEVISDHDARDDDKQGLTAFIATKLDPHEALVRLAQFESDWWESIEDTTLGKLSFDVEFP